MSEPSLLARRLCLWCEAVLPTSKRSHARTCSKACRQALSRAGGKRRGGGDASISPGTYRRLRRRAVAALSMLDTAAAAKRENIRRGFVVDAASELRELLVELDAAQREAFEDGA